MTSSNLHEFMDFLVLRHMCIESCHQNCHQHVLFLPVIFILQVLEDQGSGLSFLRFFPAAIGPSCRSGMEMEPAKQCSGAHLIKKGGARPSYLGWLDVAGMLRYVLFFKLQNLTFVMFFYAKTSLFAIFLKTYLRRIKVPNHTSV